MSLKTAMSTVATFSFVRELTKDWTEMRAYELGIIDDEGNILKKARELKTTEERESYTLFHRLVWNTKKMLEKVPGGKSKIASYAAAAWLLKENKDMVYDEIFHLFEHEEITPVRLILEEVAGAPTNVSAGVALKDMPLKKKKKKEDDMEEKDKDEIGTCALRRKIEEAKVLKRVVRQGELKKKITCPAGQIVKDGRCVPSTSSDKQRFIKAAKKRKRSMAGKSLKGALRKRTRSLRKRSSGGLV